MKNVRLDEEQLALLKSLILRSVSGKEIIYTQADEDLFHLIFSLFKDGWFDIKKPIPNQPNLKDEYMLLEKDLLGPLELAISEEQAEAIKKEIKAQARKFMDGDWYIGNEQGKSYEWHKQKFKEHVEKEVVENSRPKKNLLLSSANFSGEFKFLIAMLSFEIDGLIDVKEIILEKVCKTSMDHFLITKVDAQKKELHTCWTFSTRISANFKVESEGGSSSFNPHTGGRDDEQLKYSDGTLRIGDFSHTFGKTLQRSFFEALYKNLNKGSLHEDLVKEMSSSINAKKSERTGQTNFLNGVKADLIKEVKLLDRYILSKKGIYKLHEYPFEEDSHKKPIKNP